MVLLDSFNWFLISSFLKSASRISSLFFLDPGILVLFAGLILSNLEISLLGLEGSKFGPSLTIF